MYEIATPAIPQFTPIKYPVTENTALTSPQIKYLRVCPMVIITIPRVPATGCMSEAMANSWKIYAASTQSLPSTTNTTSLEKTAKYVTKGMEKKANKKT